MNFALKPTMPNKKSRFKDLTKARKTFASRMKRLYKDRLFTGFVLGSVILALASLVLIGLRVRPRSFVVPLRYSSFDGFDTLGAWYRVYNFALFSALVTIGNLVLAAFCLEKSRIASFFLVMGTMVVNIFTLIIVVVLTGHFES